MCVLNDSSLTWLANLKVSDLRELRQLADFGDHMIAFWRLLRTILEMFLYRCIQYEFETLGCLL
jgi:hypothetical protein